MSKNHTSCNKETYGMILRPKSFRKERKTVMKRSMRTWLPKIGATALSMALGVSVLPVLAGGSKVRAAEEWSKNKDNTGLGTSIIGNPDKPKDKDDAWRGNYVLFGTYEGEPILFRVLDNETEVYGGKTMLLDSDRVLYEEQFDQYIYDGKDYETIYAYLMWDYVDPEVEYDDEDLDLGDGYPYFPWAECDLRDRLNGADFYNKSGVFTDGEKDAIFTSVFQGGTDVRIDEDSEILLELYDGKTVSLNDKIFLLDAEDVMNPDYGYSSFAGVLPYVEEFEGFDDYDSFDQDIGNIGAFYQGENVDNRIKFDLDGGEACWWLRNTIEVQESPFEEFEEFATPEMVLVAANNGEISRYLVFEIGIGVAPAMNVDLSKVLFSSVIYEANDDMGATHKLTIIDDDLKIALTEGEKVTADGSKITVPFTITGENATQASVLIINKEYEAGNINDTNILYYGALEGEGSGTFELPSDLDVSKWGEEFFVYIIAEDINEMEETDYASAPVEVAVPEKKDDDNKTEYTITITSTGNGSAKASVTKAVEGTEVTLTVTPDEGYKFKSYDVVSGGVTITDNKFKVGTANVEIKVNFEASTSNNNNDNNNNNNSSVTSTPTPTPKPKPAANYTIIQGADSKWKIGSTTYPMVKIQRSEDDENIINYFTGVTVNGKALMKDTDYTIKEGCIEVSLTEAYMKKLTAGSYNIKIEFTDGSVTTTLTVQAADKVTTNTTTNTTTSSKSSVKTGETMMYATYGVALLAAASVLVTASYVVRKRKHVR